MSNSLVPRPGTAVTALATVSVAGSQPASGGHIERPVAVGELP
jgi:hypothetical protein